MNRKIEIINILLEAKHPLTTAYISKKLGVSNRTIRSDLMDIEPEILSRNLILVKKPRVGISIEGSRQNKDQLILDITGEKYQPIKSFTKESRINFILTKLLIGNSKLYIEYFAKTLYVSKSTIEKDMAYIAKWLFHHNLRLERKENQGVYILGQERDIRNAIAIMVSAMTECNEDIEKTICNYIHVDIGRIQKLLMKWAVHYELSFSDSNIKNLAFHIAIMINRVQRCKIIPITHQMEKQIDELREEKTVISLLKLIDTIAGTETPKEEIDYILLHVIGMSLDSNLPFIDEENMKTLEFTAEEITAEFIANIEKIVCLGLPKNLSLRKSLILHLLPTIYRLKYGLNLYNPLLHEIKENYASAYALASIINSSFKNKLGVSAGEEEIAFIALHISLAIEKVQEKITIAVVCPMGRGISRFLLIKLEEKFPQINFLNYSLKDIYDSEIPYVDMVIATVPVHIDKPHIIISAILSDEDSKLIKAFVRKFENKTKKYFSLQTIIVKHGKTEKMDILKELTERLKACHYVDQKFLDGVLKREAMGSTEIGNGIVLTHGFHESVHRSQIIFCKLDEEIVWNTQPVSFIVMMAINKKDAKNVMQMDWLYKALNSDKFIKEIVNSKNEHDIYRLLLEECDKY